MRDEALPTHIMPPGPERRKQKARKPGKASYRFRFVMRFWKHPATPLLSHAAQVAWLYCWALADPQGECFPSLARIAKRIGCSRRHAKRAVRELRQRGYLDVLKVGSNRGEHRANRYKLTLPDGDAGVPYGGTYAVP